ncbi:MAG: ATP-binding protein [Bdellovibrionota bacterium]
MGADFEITLRRSLYPKPQELNELDWKSALSENKERLKEHLSAFANYPGGGYLVFGVSDEGKIIGVDEGTKREIENQIGNLAAQALEPRVQISPFQFQEKNKNLFIIEIKESAEKPVHIRGKSIEKSYIRSGGQTRLMSKNDLKQSIINSRPQRFEELPISYENFDYDLDHYFDFSIVFDRLGNQKFLSKDAQYERLKNLKLLALIGTKYVPTNLGIITCCRNLYTIPGFERCCVRVLTIAGTSKIVSAKEKIFTSGCILELDNIVKFIINTIPHNEVIQHATRVDTPIVPEIAIRELIGNAIVHRDYSRNDSYVLVEIYNNRIEIISPGGLYADITVDRLLDHPPRTRNEVLAEFLKLLNFYEERGKGIDATIDAIEFFALPPVEFRTTSDSFTAILYYPRTFEEMSKEERINAVYQHACLCFVSNKKMNNASVRERFKFDSSKQTKVFRLLNEAVEAGRIKPLDPKAPPRYFYYVPYWA